jgi:hypothetical protein
LSLIAREEVYDPQLPNGAYYYKTKGLKHIYKDRFVSRYYIIYKGGSKQYIIEIYNGECKC